MMEKVLQTIVSVSWHIPRIERIFLSGVFNKLFRKFVCIPINFKTIH